MRNVMKQSDAEQASRAGSLREARSHRLRWLILFGVLLLPTYSQAASEAAKAESLTATPAQAETLTLAFEQHVKPFLDTYCSACHSDKKSKGDVNFSPFVKGKAVLKQLELWKDSGVKVHGLEMPPHKEMKQPSEEERSRCTAWVRALTHLSPKDPGAGTIRRLSQVEYANTLHDLLGVDRRVADQITQDVVGAGFSSSISPLLMEKYLLVADEVLDQVIFPDRLNQTWRAGQLDAVIGGAKDPGKPDGNERRLTGAGEIFVPFTAPVNGTYTFRLETAAEKVASKESTLLAVRINGQVIDQLKVTASPKTPGTSIITCKLSAGKVTLSLLMANPSFTINVLEEPKASPEKKGDGKAKTKTETHFRTVIIHSCEVLGPPAARPTDMQQQLFIAMPSKELSKRDAAKKIAETFARRAYRRPPTAEEMELLLKIFTLADSQDEMFSESIRLMLKAVLVSPGFLYLSSDRDSSKDKNGDIIPLGDHQIASRLSYLFWSTMPDAELSALADSGRLRDPSVIAAQVHRLIMDPRSRALFNGFGAAWLGMDRIDELAVDEKKFPQMTKELRSAMYEEAAMLFDVILRENRSIVDFITSDFTFMNHTLAKIYGLEDSVKGSQMSRVQLLDPNRGGILTLPGILAVTSLPNRTSPVKRGVWVLEQVLGQEQPTPPADVPALEQQDVPAMSGLNLRQRTERHREDPACTSCHQSIDPIGFGLENFDVIGRWRNRDDTGAPVDATGELPGNKRFSTPANLKSIVAMRKDDFVRGLVRKILSYTLCRTLYGYDEVVVDHITEAVIKDGYRFETVWVQVATSYPFLNRRISR